MKKRLLIFLVVVFPLLIVFSPFLFGHRIFAKGDILLELYPYWHFFQENFSANNQIPLWQSNMLSGFPLYASVIGGFFYPLNWLFFKFFNFINAYNWLIFIDFIFLALASYWLGRILKLSKIPCLIVSSTFVFSQFIFNYGAVLVNAHLYFVLPLLFICLCKVYQKEYQYILLGGLALGVGWLAGHLQFVSYIAVSGFFFALFLDRLSWSKTQKWFKQGKVFKCFILIFLISIIIGSFQLISTYEFSQLSVRAGGLSYSEVGGSAVGLIDSISYILPNFNLPYFSSGGKFLYISFLSLIFALIAIFYYLKKNKYILFFSFLFLFSLAASLKYSPIFWLLHQLPIFESFRVPGRWMFIGVFSLSVLAGFSCQYLYLERVKEKFAVILKIIKYLVFSIAALVIVLTVIFKFFGDKIISFIQNKIVTAEFMQSHYLPEEHYLNVIQNNIYQAIKSVNLFDSGVFVPLIMAFCSIFFIYFYLRNKINKNNFLVLSLVLIILNGMLVFGNYYKKLPDKFLTDEPKTADFIKAQENEKPFRIYSLFVGLSEFTKINMLNGDSFLESFYFKKEMIDTNFNILYDMDSIDSYENLMSRRQARLLAYLGSERATLGEKLVDEKTTTEEKINKFLSRLNLLSMSNVKYIISSDKLDDQRLRLVFKTKATRYQIPVYIYENLEVMPRIYFAEDVNFINNDENANFNLLINPEIDFNKTTFIECFDCNDEIKEGFSEIKIEEYKSGLLKLKVKTENPKWLIFSESDSPVWRAKIDGWVTDIYTANYIYQAVLSPSGEHIIEFEYLGVTENE